VYGTVEKIENKDPAIMKKKKMMLSLSSQT
jgi:hypothetical protein